MHVRRRILSLTHLYMHTHIHISVCVCVCSLYKRKVHTETQKVTEKVLVWQGLNFYPHVSPARSTATGFISLEPSRLYSPFLSRRSKEHLDTNPLEGRYIRGLRNEVVGRGTAQG